MTAWQKSTYSGGALACIEVAWRRACSGGAPCVEVADTGGQVLIRDSKLADESPILAVPPGVFRALVDWCKEA